jgi:hypothetical protein
MSQSAFALVSAPHPRNASSRGTRRLSHEDQLKIDCDRQKWRLTCGNVGAACGNRTHDLRITRAPRKHSQRSTSTDGTPHCSQATQGPGRTRFVSHSLSHDAPAALNRCLGCRCRSGRALPAAVRGKLADDRVRRHLGSQLPGSALCAPVSPATSSTSPRWRIPITCGLMISWPSFQVCQQAGRVAGKLEDG